MIPHLLDEGGCSGVIPQNWHLTWTFRVLLDSSSLLIFYLYKYSLPQAPRRGPHELFSQPFFFWRHPHELLRMTQVENTALPVSWQMFLTWLRPFFHKQIETHQRIEEISQIEIEYNYSLLFVLKSDSYEIDARRTTLRVAASEAGERIYYVVIISFCRNRIFILRVLVQLRLPIIRGDWGRCLGSLEVATGCGLHQD